MTANVKANSVDGAPTSTSDSTILNARETSSTEFPPNDSSVEPSQPTNDSGKLDRVREIIFGQQNREYSQLFDAMTRDIKRLQQELHRLNEQLSAQKQSHGNQTEELSLQFTQKLKVLEEQQQTKFTEIDKKQNQDIQDLQSMVRRIQDELYDEVRQTTERLGTEKTDRAVLGDLLIELGTNLREGPSNSLIAGLLEHLDENL